MSTQMIEEKMSAAGFVSTKVAVEATGLAVSSLQRSVKNGKMKGQRCGYQWYISAASLLRHFAGTPMEEHIKKTLLKHGCTPKPNTDVIVLPARKKPGRKPAKKA